MERKHRNFKKENDVRWLLRYKVMGLDFAE